MQQQQQMILTIIAIIAVSQLIFDVQTSDAQFVMPSRIRRPNPVSVQRLLKMIEELDLSDTGLNRRNQDGSNSRYSYQTVAPKRQRETPQGRMVVRNQRCSPLTGSASNCDYDSTDLTSVPNRKQRQLNAEITCDDCSSLWETRSNNEEKRIARGKRQIISLSKLIDTIYAKHLEKICAEKRCFQLNN